MTYQQFWLRYLQAHSRPGTRFLHYCGSALVILCLLLAIITRHWFWLLGMPLFGYGFAWTAHFVIEHNKPETFGHPVWSLISDFRMFFLWLTGRLKV